MDGIDLVKNAVQEVRITYLTVSRSTWALQFYMFELRNLSLKICYARLQYCCAV